MKCCKKKPKSLLTFTHSQATLFNCILHVPFIQENFMHVFEVLHGLVHTYSPSLITSTFTTTGAIVYGWLYW